MLLQSKRQGPRGGMTDLKGRCVPSVRSCRSRNALRAANVFYMEWFWRMTRSDRIAYGAFMLIGGK
jgi:hypothetical protein